MRERTEQEQRIEKTLEELATLHPQYIKITFVSHADKESLSHRGRDTAAIRIPHTSYVTLILVEPKLPKDLDKWADALLEAQVMVGEIEQEVAWKKTDPNFFNAMKFKFGN